ncbi:MAG TPA: hypothetical protein DCQ93_05775 [Bacteroidetes bacterium]|nr:hypothetical protein [Bacteroidota bacterium]
MKLAVFDFDGTLTARDSFFSFLIEYFSFSKIISGIIILLPVFIFYKLRWMNPDKAKEKVIRYFFTGQNIYSVKKFSSDFSASKIPALITERGNACLKKYKDNNFKIVILSASLEVYLKPWCDSQGFECIATQLKIENEKFTGDIDGHNCRGNEKLIRLKEKYDLGSFEEIHSFGNSRSDKPFMSVANHSFYRTLPV